ncbi:MAG: electron transfer flavoprotein subunit beta/FixA family protein [Candidatus Brocadiia bacterium]
MHIVVCVKQVPDTAEVRIDAERGTLVREGVPSILNPLDAHAVEAAVALREKLGKGRVTALSMGPPQALAAVRECIARGCDGGVLLTDRAFAGADTWSTSYTLACAVRSLGDVGLVLCGKQAIDGDTAQVGPELAAHLGWPQVTYARRLKADAEGRLVVERLTDYGNETVRVEPPAVVTALKDLNVPRLPSLHSQMRARRAEPDRWGPGRIDGDAEEFGLNGSPTRVKRVFTPPPRGECTRLEGEPDHVAARLAEVLIARRNAP